MKRTVSFLLAVMLIAGLIGAVPFSAFAAGGVEQGYAPVGTAVSTAADFAAMSADGSYYLSADITISASYANEFKGVFDGNGKTVTTTAPLFASVSGTVKNVTVSGEISNSDVNTAAVAATALAGASFENIANTAKVTTTGTTGGAGAVVGLISGADVVISGCTNTGDITNGKYTGGMVGHCTGANAKIIDCENSGAVTGGSGATGGIAGYFKCAGTLIENCKNSGAVSCNSQNGGILGYATLTVTVSGCLNSGEVKASGTNGYSGGIISRLGDTPVAGNKYIITDCVNTGNVTSGKDNGGGILAYCTDGVDIISCFNSGNIYAKRAGGIGGALGGSKSLYPYTIKNCINVGEVKSWGNHAAGILGYAYGRSVAWPAIYNCINMGDVISETNYAAGILGYVNAAKTEIINCASTGKLTVFPNDKIEWPTFAIYMNRSASSTKVYGNYFPAGYAKYTLSGNGTADGPKDSDGAKIDGAAGLDGVRTDFDNTADYILSDEAYKSGELCFLLNAGAKALDPELTADVFYQTLGNDDYPVIDSTHATISKLGDSLYVNGKAAIFDGNDVQINSYNSFEEALAAVKDGETLRLYEGITIREPIVIKNSITLDANGVTINAVLSEADYAITIDAAGKIVTLRNLTLYSNYGGVEIAPSDDSKNEEVNFVGCRIFAAESKGDTDGTNDANGVFVGTATSVANFIGNQNEVRAFTGSAVESYGITRIEAGYFRSTSDVTLLATNKTASAKQTDSKILLYGGVVVNYRGSAAAAEKGAGLYIYGGKLLTDSVETTASCITAGSASDNGFVYIFDGEYYTNSKGAPIASGSGSKVNVYGGTVYTVSDSAQALMGAITLDEQTKASVDKNGDAAVIWEQFQYICRVPFNFVYSVVADESKSAAAAFKVTDEKGATVGYADSLAYAQALVPSGGTVTLNKNITVSAPYTIMLLKDVDWTLDGQSHKITVGDSAKNIYAVAFVAGDVSAKDIAVENAAGAGIYFGTPYSKFSAREAVLKNVDVTAGAGIGACIWHRTDIEVNSSDITGSSYSTHVYQDCNADFTDSKLTQTDASSGSYGVYSRQGSALTFTGTTVSAAKGPALQIITGTAAYNGSAVFNKGTVIKSDNGYGIVCNPYNSMTFNGGEFTGTAADAAVNIGGAGAYGVIYDGVFSCNKTCAVRAYKGGVLDIYGGTFSLTANVNGSAVRASTASDPGTVNIYGGTFNNAGKAPVINAVRADAVVKIVAGVFNNTGENDIKVFDNTGVTNFADAIDFPSGSKTYEIKALEAAADNGGAEAANVEAPAGETPALLEAPAADLTEYDANAYDANAYAALASVASEKGCGGFAALTWFAALLCGAFTFVIIKKK